MEFYVEGMLEGYGDDSGAPKGSLSPLRKRMMEDMDLAGLASTTCKTYISVIVKLQKRAQRRPDRLSEEDVRRYLLWLRDEKGVARGTFQTCFYALKFFYCNTLGYDWSLFLKKGCACPIRSGFHAPFRGRIVPA